MISSFLLNLPTPSEERVKTSQRTVPELEVKGYELMGWMPPSAGIGV
ncbi:Hypothetical protein NGAL_HAMBI1145_58930 [Neorhizobium galegae bv. officinalis]|uniref:Uncharacterized protein n=1 Tax=Neorhizobium galegae bv. officinalis TaxID=323656 RepID=A0A0T7H1W8_NEOGA|nr:hypothetical protein [Neorhizobium galegae]CDZ41433.1 Hypothetical protein NGAL_HAMBI1145_58930 [Neorhizobium galegae bv. officinalis]CDZ53433.1 Hypothetical protein NGAL_HAMBI1189_49870 [Neorhizobium galegae bv. officinalis]